MPRLLRARPVRRARAAAAADRAGRAWSRELAAGKRSRRHPVLQGEGWWRRPTASSAQPVVAAPPPSRRCRLSPARRPPRRRADPHQRRHRHARPRLRARLRGTQPRLPPARPRRDGHRRRRPRWRRRSQRWKPWAVSTPAATSASTTPRATPSAACARTRPGRRCWPRRCAARRRSACHVLERPGLRRPRRPALGRERCAGAAQRLRPSKAAAERAVLARAPRRAGRPHQRLLRPVGPSTTSSVHALRALARGGRFRAADDVRVSPTYVPDLVHACLDLLIDGESGIWHLANAGDVSWAELAAEAATLAGIDAARCAPCRGADLATRGAGRATACCQRARQPDAVARRRPRPLRRRAARPRTGERRGADLGRAPLAGRRRSLCRHRQA